MRLVYIGLCLIGCFFPLYSALAISNTKPVERDGGEDAHMVEFTVAALPSIVSRKGGGYASGVNGLGLINPDSGEWVPLGLVPRLRRSKPIWWNAVNPIVIYQGSGWDGRLEEGEEFLLDEHLVSRGLEEGKGPVSAALDKGLSREIGRIFLPEGRGPFLLLLSPRDRYSYQINVLPDDPQSMPEGSIKVINATVRQLACQIGEEVYTLDPGESRVARTRLGEPAMVPIRFAAFDHGRESWQQTWATSILIKPNERRFMLIPPGVGDRPHNPPLFIR